MGKQRLILTLALVLMMFADAPQLSTLPMAFVHHFFHISWWHLAANLLGVWVCFRRDNWKELGIAYIIGTLSFLLVCKPCIGFSNIIFAVSGMRMRDWKQSALFISIMLAMCFIPRISALTHIVAFSLGFIYERARTIINKADEDYRRVADR